MALTLITAVPDRGIPVPSALANLEKLTLILVPVLSNEVPSASHAGWFGNVVRIAHCGLTVPLRACPSITAPAGAGYPNERGLIV